MDNPADTLQSKTMALNGRMKIITVYATSTSKVDLSDLRYL